MLVLIGARNLLTSWEQNAIQVLGRARGNSYLPVLPQGLLQPLVEVVAAIHIILWLRCHSLCRDLCLHCLILFLLLSIAAAGLLCWHCCSDWLHLLLCGLLSLMQAGQVQTRKGDWDVAAAAEINHTE